MLKNLRNTLADLWERIARALRDGGTGEERKP
jgi:hypothetical protein